MRRLGRWPPGVGSVCRGVALSTTRNRNARHLDPRGCRAKGNVIGVVGRQAGVAHGARYTQATEDLHGTCADVVASDAGRLSGSARLGQRHPDATSGEIHRQTKADAAAAHDQDLGIDTARHRSDFVWWQGTIGTGAIPSWLQANRRSSRIAQLLAAKRANRQPAGASALTGNPTVLSLLRLEPIAARALP